MSHVVPECYYERMDFQECKGTFREETYNDFLAWNKSCLEELSFDDVKWVWGLCDRMNHGRIGMMDMEDCGIWEADTVFYDRNKNLIIVHPR
jgi:hypothetical protein